MTYWSLCRQHRSHTSHWPERVIRLADVFPPLLLDRLRLAEALPPLFPDRIRLGKVVPYPRSLVNDFRVPCGRVGSTLRRIESELLQPIQYERSKYDACDKLLSDLLIDVSYVCIFTPPNRKDAVRDPLLPRSETQLSLVVSNPLRRPSSRLMICGSGLR